MFSLNIVITVRRAAAPAVRQSLAAPAGLAALGAYARAVARRVEAAGAWRELARRLRAAALLSWFENQPSPAYTLLYYVKVGRLEGGVRGMTS